MTFTRQSFIALLFGLILTSPAMAMDLGAAKSQGLIGETATGYLAIVKPSADAQALVTDINQKRKTHYEKIAKKNGISLQAVEARAGQKAISKTPSGQYVDTGAGWSQK